MDIADLRRMRLSAQRLAAPTGDVAETVRWMGALQAQDYQGALWAIGVRTQDATLRDIEIAIERREIVRTWPMRGTLHFISPELLRPALRITGPRIKQRIATRERQLGIDDDVLRRAAKVIAAEVAAGPRTRPELYAAMATAGLEPEGQRGIHILGQLARDLLLCLGPHRGKQPTFVLLDDWLPAGNDLPDAEAARELALRYFRSHGPATVHDFAWWSNLTVAEARNALSASAGDLEAAEIGGKTYWFDSTAVRHDATDLCLLPPFDEFIIGYADRSSVSEPEHLRRVIPGNNGMFLASMVDERGELRGLWRKTSNKSGVTITTEPFDGPLEAASLERATRRYRGFLSGSELQRSRV